MSSLAIRPLTAADLPFGLDLSTSAGWNQTPADWRRVLALDEHASYVATLEGRDVGVVTSVTFGPVAWVGLMLVDASVRRRGVGRALMERVIETLDERGVRSVRLDATPLGQGLYEQLGFRIDYSLRRYFGTPTSAVVPPGDEVLLLRQLVSEDGAQVAALDAAVTGTPRKALLAALWRERPADARGAFDAESGELRGFVLARSGRLGMFVGPCIGDALAGERLLTAALADLAGVPSIVDLAAHHVAAPHVAERYGLVPVRSLTRMTRGQPVVEDAARYWASSGPEKG